MKYSDKQIGFDNALVELIENGTKTLTYRVAETWNFLEFGDYVLVKDSSTEKTFGVLKIEEKRSIFFKDIPLNKEGHEIYESEEDKKAKFEKYYGRPIEDEEAVIILGFKFEKLTLKDFTEWTAQKTVVANEKERPFFRDAEVWTAALGANVGFEQDGRGENYLRPIVVLRKFNNEVCWGIPLTRNEKKGEFYYSFNLNNQTSTAILSQVKLIDAKRLYYQLGKVSDDDFAELKKRFKALLP
jgi:mRNA interferase MazF